MSDLTNAAESALVAGLLTSVVGVTPPAGGWWLGLHTADPGETAASEVAGNAYARQQIAPAKWTDQADGSALTNLDIVFPVATASWGTIMGLSLWTANAAGVAWWSKLLPAQQQKLVAAGTQYRVVAGNLRVRFL